MRKNGSRPGFYGKKVHLEHFALYTLFADYGAIQKYGDAYKLKKHAVLDAKNRADVMAFAHQKDEGFIVCRVRIDEVFRVYKKGSKYARKVGGNGKSGNDL